jgi:hypothetical protein
VSKLWGTKNVRLSLKCILERVVSLRVTGILNHEPHFCDANPLYLLATCIRILRQQLETFSMCMHTELAYPVEENTAETVKRTVWRQSRAVMDEEEEENSPPLFRGGE